MEGEILIDKNNLINYAKKKNYNLGQAEKDYYQEIILFILYQNFGKDLIFKGGTALTKCYGLNRFSEDLDFISLKENNFSKIINDGLNNFYIEFEFEEKKHTNSIDITYWLKGPLFNGNKNSMCKILLDINLKEKNFLEPEKKQIGLFVDEIPVFEVIVLSQTEIFLEKIRTILQRNKARDLYDIYYLSLRSIMVKLNQIEKKLGKNFDIVEFESKLDEKEIIWETELKPLVKSFPKFSIVKEKIMEFIKKID